MTTRRLTGAVVLVLLSGVMAGCHYYADFRIKQTQADVQEERAELMRAYRECLEKYESDPRKAREFCSAYTQSLRELETKR